jgi:DNA-binding LacI/PurR family transcriptional regulator
MLPDTSVSDTLRRKLLEGKITGGTRLPPLRQLASQFNVSTITVRQALRTLEEEGHLHCIAGVGVFVQPTVPPRAKTDTTTVGFVTIEIESAFTTQIAHYLEQSCQQRGWGMQLFNAQGDNQLEARNLSRLAASGLGGAIILPVDDTQNFEAMVQLKLSGFPMVLVDRPLPGLKIDIVESHHEKGAYLATRYLLEHGHAQVFMVTQMLEMASVRARIRGYEQALVDHGLEPLRAWKVWLDNEAVLRGCAEGRRWLGGYEGVLPLLRSVKSPVAIFAHNAYSGWGVFEACRELGLNVPRDVSIICFDDAEFTRALSPPMTAIRQRTDEIARNAIELLERRMAGSTAEPQRVQIEVDLIERGSVAPPLRA